jgi:predicted NAD/FAD-dependent oxidoreductase
MIFDYLIIGAGLSGSLLSFHFEEKKISHLVIDKGRGIGGRLSSKRFEPDNFFNHGSQTIPFNEYEKKIWFQKWIDNQWLKKRKNNWSIESKSSNLIKSLIKNENVVLNEEASLISFEKSLYQIHMRSGQIIQARKVILTAPLPQSVKLAEKFIDSENLELMNSILFQKKIILFLENKKLLRFSMSEEFSIETKDSTHMISLSDQLSENLFEKTNDEICQSLFTKLNSFFEEFLVTELQVKKWRYSQSVTSLAAHYYENSNHTLFICGDAFCSKKTSSIDRTLHSTYKLLTESKLLQSL